MKLTKENIIKRLKEEMEFSKNTGMHEFTMGLSQAAVIIESEFKEELG